MHSNIWNFWNPSLTLIIYSQKFYFYFKSALNKLSKKSYTILDAWMEGWMDVSMDGWMYGWMYGWMVELITKAMAMILQLILLLLRHAIIQL